MRGCKQYTRRFLDKMEVIFVKGRLEHKVDRNDPEGVRKWTAGQRDYYRHAISAIGFMRKQLEFYREAPDYTQKANPKG